MERQALTIRLPESAVLDSSVVLKWFRKDEIWRDSALKLRQTYLDGRIRIYVPDLLVYEIANVLRYKPDMTQQKVHDALLSLYDMQVRIIEVSPEIIKAAIDLAYRYDITVYDAAFVAAAEYLKISFITADDTLSEKLAGVPSVHHISLFL